MAWFWRYDLFSVRNYIRPLRGRDLPIAWLVAVCDAFGINERMDAKLDL
jgi:hypothetical protein